MLTQTEKYPVSFKALLAFLLIPAFISGCSKTAPGAKDLVLMDTFVRVEVPGTAHGVKKNKAIEKAAERMRTLEKKWDVK